MDKNTVTVGGRFICEYVEQPDCSCSGCGLKGCKECEEAECQDLFIGKCYR